MKRLAFSLLLVATVAWFAACSLEAPAMGHLSISIPAAATSKALAGSRSLDLLSGVANPAIRIYVVLNGSFIQFLGKNYYQKNLTAATSASSSNDTMTIDLAPSTGYQVYVALGSAPTSGGWMPVYSGATDPFTISSGTVTSVSLPASAVPFVAEASSTAAQAAYVNGTLYRVFGGTVQYFTTGVGFSSGFSIGTKFSNVYSFSSGEWWAGSSGFVPEAWINTDTGIWAVSSSGLFQRSAFVGVGAIASSAVTGVTANGLSNCIVMVSYGNGDVRYAYSNQAQSQSQDYTAADWTTGSVKDYLGSDSSLSSLIPDPSSFVKAFAFAYNGSDSTSCGFVSTSLGCFFYNSTDQAAITSDPATWLKNQVGSSNADTISAVFGGKSQIITSLALDDALSPTNVYAGTKAGLFYGPSNISAGAALTQAGTVAVIKLAASTFGSPSSSFAAYIDAQGNLVILKNQAQVASYPFYSYCASPGSVTSLAFYVDGVDGANLKLAVASSDSYAALTVQ
jgi:hypothetical protein